MRQLAISEERYQRAASRRTSWASQRAELEITRALLPPLKSQREAVDHQPAVYSAKRRLRPAYPASGSRI